jgi:hypothetical protein
LSAILGLYVGHVQSLDTVSAQVAQQEMQRLLAPAGIELVWNSTGQDVAQAVVGSFEGSCSLEALPVSLSNYAGPGALAETSLSSTRVLPYFRVDCNRLIRTLMPTLQPLSMPLRRAVFGRALGRVMAHEVYHIISQRKDHDESGVAKACFSLDDLIARQFEFDLPTIERMRPVPLLARSR